MHNEVEPTLQLPTLRQVVIPLFRHRTAVVVTFAVLAAAVVLGIALMPRMYEADMKLLVNRERADTVMTANAQSQGPVSGQITEDELFGEVELIQSREVIQRVVHAIGIDRLLPPTGTPPNRNRRAWRRQSRPCVTTSQSSRFARRR